MEMIGDPTMPEEKGEQTKSATGPVAVKRIAPPPMREMLGPLGVDQAVRTAITQCWMMLPESERSPERVEKEIRRLVQRALEDMKEDAAAFGFSK